MADLAAQLCDRVLPGVPIRQWVLTFPWKIRFLLAFDPELQKHVRRIFITTILRWMEKRAERRGLAPAKGGAAILVQRFGSALNLNLHFHALVLDGVYSIENPSAQPEFHEASALRDSDVLALTRILHDRIIRALRRRGHLADEGDVPPDEPDDLLLAMISAASVHGRVALGSKAGTPIARVRVDPGKRPTFVPGELCADWEGFSLHAKVRIEHDQRDKLERLCRYVARPPLAIERLSLLPDGRVAHELRRPWRDGTTHMLFDPLTFIERLAALVPRPRRPLLTYHGVLAPAASWRDSIVPVPDSDDSSERCSHSPDEPPAKRWRTWAELMKRAFEVDVLVCPHCHGARKLISLITDPPVIRRILSHLKLPLEFPFVTPARAPPEPSLPF